MPPNSAMQLTRGGCRRVGASSSARVIVNEGAVVRPSQLIASVRRTRCDGGTGDGESRVSASSRGGPMNTRWMAVGLCLWCMLASSRLLVQAQSPHPTAAFDHVALHVRDLQRSAEFYRQVLQLETIGEPFKDGRHLWLRLGVHQQLHLIGGASKSNADDIDVHFALRVTSLQEFCTHLAQLKVKYFSTRREEGLATTRPDGVKQVYLQDPDGYWIEVNDSRV